MASDEMEKLRLELLSGNSRFLGEQYTEHRSDLIQFFKSRYDSTETEAEDMFSEAILILRKKIIERKIEHLDNIKSYLITTVNYMHKEDFRNKLSRNRKTEEVRKLLYEHGQTNEIDNLEMKELNKKVCSLALRSLGGKCEQILRLYYLEEMKLKDIAVLMGFANTNVAKSTKSRCYSRWVKAAHSLKQKMK